MKNLDMMIESPKISDLQENLNNIEAFFEELKETGSDELHKEDLIGAIINSAKNELQNAKGCETIDDLSVKQQARIFADLFCLESLFFEDEEDFDEEEDELEEEDSFLFDEEEEE